jgi:hypothetical protein
MRIRSKVLSLVGLLFLMSIQMSLGAENATYYNPLGIFL